MEESEVKKNIRNKRKKNECEREREVGSERIRK
jgi:hypothetical protein